MPGSKLPMLGMVISPLIGILIMGIINPYYWVDDQPLLYGNNGSLDPGTYIMVFYQWCVLGQLGQRTTTAGVFSLPPGLKKTMRNLN